MPLPDCQLPASPPAMPSMCGIDARAQPRFRLMMRTSKLICGPREFLCVVRDISQSGIRLRLFHPIPDGELALELANGERFSIRHVWHAGDEAGFRFLQPVDVESFMAEPALYPKRPIRLRMVIGASLSFSGVATSIDLHDISQHGAGIRCGLRLETGQIVCLALAGGQPFYARVRWGAHPSYGLIFERAFRLDELASIVWDWHRAFMAPALQAAG